jgi:hypothetical protein
VPAGRAGRRLPGAAVGPVVPVGPAVAVGTFGVLVALLASACGGGTPAPKVASLGPTPSTTAAQVAAPSTQPAAPSAGAAGGSSSALVKQAVKYAGCMRKHGVTGFPDPDGAGSFSLAALASLDRSSPQFQSAANDCQALRPLPSAQALTQDNTALLKFSTCMRSHGELKFPDFDLGSGNAARLARQYLKTIDPLSPVFQAAFQACRPLLPPIIGSALGS